MSDERQCFYLDGKPVTLETLCRKEPGWAANRLREGDRQLAAALAKVAELEQELADVHALDAWLRADKNHQLVTDLGVVHGESVSLLFNDERGTAVHKVETTFAAARRAAVEYLKSKESKT